MTREEEIKKQAEKKALEPSRLMHPYAKQYKVMSAYEIGYIEGAVWADAHPHWISVEDELPPKESEYDDLSNNVLATNGKEIYESVYNHDSKDWFTHDMWGLDNITHWMPLPEAPSSSEFPNNHIIDADKKVDRVIGTADHIKIALDVLNKKGDEK